MNPLFAKPEHLILQHLLVPPIPIRPSVAMDASQGRCVDTLQLNHFESETHFCIFVLAMRMT